MHVHTRIQKWGNGLGLRVSGLMRDVPKLYVGAEVDVDVTEHGFTIRKVEPKKLATSLRYSEAQLLAGLDPVTAHADLLTEPLPHEIDPHGC